MKKKLSNAKAKAFLIRVGNKLRKARESRSLSLESAAESVGMKAEQLILIENGEVDYRLDVLYAICITWTFLRSSSDKLSVLN